jgi:hypothetical protein
MDDSHFNYITKFYNKKKPWIGSGVFELGLDALEFKHHALEKMWQNKIQKV